MGSSSDGSEAIAWLAILVIGLAVFAIVGVHHGSCGKSGSYGPPTRSSW
ncbi:MAG: hypothetical protein ACC700_16655 [Anaerolineales bacterium]